MGELVILEDYKKKRAEEELEALKQRVSEAMTDINVYPSLTTDAAYTYVPGDFAMDKLTLPPVESVGWDWLSTSLYSSSGYCSYGEDDES